MAVRHVRRGRVRLERVDHRPKHANGLLAALRCERRERADDEGNLTERSVVLFHVALQPPGRRARVPARVLLGDQGEQLECVSERDAAELAREPFRDGEVSDAQGDS